MRSSSIITKFHPANTHIRPLHMLKSREFYYSESEELINNSRPLMSISLSIHDHESTVSEEHYTKGCYEQFLPAIVEPFRNHTETKSLLMIVGQATLFLPSESDPEEFKSRGGHILTCRVQIPSFNSLSAITIQDVISKLPGKKLTPSSHAKLRDGRILKNQEYTAEAIYETSTNLSLFRNSGNPIDQNNTFAPAPVFITLVDLDRIDLYYNSVYLKAQQIAQRDSTYKRMKHACGHFIIESFLNDFPLTHQHGISVQLAFETILSSYIAQYASKPGFKDAIYRTCRDYGITLPPTEMQHFGKELEREYKKQGKGNSLIEKLTFSKNKFTVESENINLMDRVGSSLSGR